MLYTNEEDDSISAKWNVNQALQTIPEIIVEIKDKTLNFAKQK